MRVNRRTAFAAGAVGTFGALVLGAAAFAGGGVGSSTARPRTLAVARLGQVQAPLAAGATRDIKVLDAGTVSIAVDSTASTFTVGTIVVSTGWKAVPTVVDGTNASVLFTNATRRVVVTMVFDTGVLTVTITEVPQDPTTTTMATSVAPTTSTTVATTQATTTAPTTEVTTTTAATPAAPTTTTVAGPTTTALCTGGDEGDDDDQGEECDDHEDGKKQSTSSTVAGSNKKHHDDDDDKNEHEHEGGGGHGGGGDD
jgi:hypothetical protein